MTKKRVSSRKPSTYSGILHLPAGEAGNTRIDAIGFKEKVFDIVKKIPKGKVLTYKEVAKRAGKPRAYRAVGNILHTNFNKNIPCHRVIRSDGGLGGYNRGAREKAKLLAGEKAKF